MPSHVEICRHRRFNSRDGDGRTSVGSLGTTDQTLSTVHGNAPHDVLAEMLRDLEDELLAIFDGLKRVENGGELLGIELDCRPRQLHVGGSCPQGRVEATELLTIDDGTDDLVDLAVTNTGGAGEPAEGRSPEAGRANGATSRRREGGTGPGEGGNAALEHRDDDAGRTSSYYCSGVGFRSLL